MKGAGGGRASAGLQPPAPALAPCVGPGFFLTYFPTCPGTGCARPVGEGKAPGQPRVRQRGGGTGGMPDLGVRVPLHQIQALGCIPKAGAPSRRDRFLAQGDVPVPAIPNHPGWLPGLGTVSHRDHGAGKGAGGRPGSRGRGAAVPSPCHNNTAFHPRLGPLSSSFPKGLNHPTRPLSEHPPEEEECPLTPTRARPPEPGAPDGETEARGKRWARGARHPSDPTGFPALPLSPAHPPKRRSPPPPAPRL